MGRREYEPIKSNIKFHKPDDEDAKDKAWRVRQMMIKFSGKISFKEFIRGKPIRFGIKMLALCASNGYSFYFDIYCGKNEKFDFLPKIVQGSRVVLQMLQEFLLKTSPRNRLQYHIYFDNLFSSPDLLVHLKNKNLRATSTVRKDRIEVSNEIDAKARRGLTKVKHDSNSGTNFVTVMDSKAVSILSSAAGVTSTSNVSRYDKEANGKAAIPFLNAYKVYNNFMGGVDLHDQHCNNLMQ
ncbi:piggyBac transposable element-derived protein 3-like [Belonocnema kinseyi]|uniref:piggyBac transposable element-derived protein 3-like n=1 Tax=Belonocnema kinseyi TaxID=2817044 RepID=UPI00143D999D|nr:piggyBac transposable element-derived protein 3-like [Belonocnema kinseyi]